MYVVKRGDRFWFRKIVPVDLVDVLGIAEIRRSLRTASAREARRRALDVLVRVEDVYEVLRSERPLRPARDVAMALLEQALSTNEGTPGSFEVRDRTLRDARGAMRRTGDRDVSVGRPADAAGLGEIRTDDVVTAVEALHLLRREGPRGEENRIAVSILEAVARMTQGGLPDTVQGLEDLDGALETLATLRSAESALGNPATFEAFRALFAGLMPPPAPARDDPSVKEIVASTLRDELARSEAERWSAMPVADAIAQFVAEESSKRGGAKHQQDVPRRLASFLTCVGNKPIRDVSRDDAKAYRDLLDRVPDRFVQRFKTYDLREAIAANDKCRVPNPAIGSVTVDLKYLGPVRRMFEYLVREGLIASNPFTDIRSRQQEQSGAKSKRLPLKTAHINGLLALTSKEPVLSATYWLPIIMLFSGARPGELAQLKVGDLREDYNGRPHLNVLCLDDTENEEPDVVPLRKGPKETRTVKTHAGHRLVPVHPMLVRMGILDLFERRRRVSDVRGQLFGDVAPNAHGHYSAAVTRRINRRLRSLGVENKRFVLYSLRHNFIDACHAAGMPDVARMKMVGHQMNGMGGVYGNPLPEPWESAWIEKVAYEGLDLEPYLRMASKIPAPGTRTARQRTW
ncbi:DUF6538 domain-containing protein [Methylobacterium gossipiicola]|uniref:Site-specific recombinase XerD n=1 Tax=Methylobacterium gossipiicola TaxID=582675 RepID=A0A1I2T712_9HYPH|nr:DUF6538 domain-containing protein [Methylobacterium gossipiicola]SFG58326.1 Site-specific recombinase XerD [Methylobacterium gossipiicola]